MDRLITVGCHRGPSCLDNRVTRTRCRRSTYCDVAFPQLTTPPRSRISPCLKPLSAVHHLFLLSDSRPLLCAQPRPRGLATAAIDRRNAGSASVLSWRNAANARFELRRARAAVRRPDFLAIENPFLPSLSRPGILPGVSTYRTVQNCEATSARN